MTNGHLRVRQEDPMREAVIVGVARIFGGRL